MKFEIEPLANAHCNTGENPLWHAEKRCVYWEDIPAGRVFRLDVDTLAWEKIYEGGVVGGFTIQRDGRLLLFGQNRVDILNDDGSLQNVARDLFPRTGRFNDVMADPFGGVVAGTMTGAEAPMARRFTGRTPPRRRFSPSTTTRKPAHWPTRAR